MEFAAAAGGRYGWCKACYSQTRRVHHRALAERIARRELAAGRDPALHRGYSHYSRDPDDVLLDAKRRRAERLRAAQTDGYSREAIFERDGWRCWLCGLQLDPNNATIDHVIPIAAGGDDTAANVRAACSPCNSRRGARDPEVMGDRAQPTSVGSRKAECRPSG